MEYSNLSVKLTKLFNKKTKKNEGIFFTPTKTIEMNLNYLKPFFKNTKSVLEPSCGSCEYIIQIGEKIKNCNVIGIEKNKKIYDKVKHINNDKIKIYNYDFLKWNTKKRFDLIIGNPPYVLLEKKTTIQKYESFCERRPNLCVIFLLKCLELLKTNGVLSFILPSTFLNSLYYNKVREYIIQNFKIIHIEYCSENI